jgi:four helix bundle protein
MERISPKSEARMTNELPSQFDGTVTQGVPTENVQSSDTPEVSARKYDLEERTALFAEAIIGFVKRISVTAVTQPLIRQLVRSATSIGANYGEADDSGTNKEFRYRIGICKRESRETKYWLRMLATAVPSIKNEARAHWQEAKELHLIFAAIYRRQPRPGAPPTKG